MNTNSLITQHFFNDITLRVNQLPAPDMIWLIAVVFWSFLFLKSHTNSDISFHSLTRRPDNYNSVWGGIIEDPLKKTTFLQVSQDLASSGVNPDRSEPSDRTMEPTEHQYHL